MELKSPETPHPWETQHMPSLTFYLCLGLNIVVMIPGINILQEIFAIDMLTAVKSSSEHDPKHVLRLLRLYRDRS